jgi:hypothetical protein
VIQAIWHAPRLIRSRQEGIVVSLRRALMAVVTSSACAVLVAGLTMMAGPAGAAPAAGNPGTARSALAAVPRGHWGGARQISLAGLKTSSNPEASVTQLSCSSPGDCTAAGQYDDDTGSRQVFVAAEAGGVWGKALPVPHLSDLNASGSAAVNALSCAAPGDCALGGRYEDGNGVSQAFVADSVRGRWGDAHALTTVSAGQLIAEVTSLSCAKAGDCAAGVTLPVTVALAGGGTELIGEAFVANEHGGTWSAPQPVKGIPAGQRSDISSVSCWSTGNCMAGGSFFNGHGHALLVAEIGGSWRDGIEVPGISDLPGFSSSDNAQVLSVSCPGAGACTASGTYPDGTDALQSFVTRQASGTWRTQSVPGSLSLNKPGGDTSPVVSCGAPGDCGLVSPYPQDSQHQRIFAAAETGGVWGTARDVLGAPSTGVSAEVAAGVSCGGPGSCVAAGDTGPDSGGAAAFLAEEIRGTWTAARPIAGNLNAGNEAAALAASCARPGNCAAGGSYTDAHGNGLPFVADESTVTSTALSLSVGKVTFGREQTGRFTVHVMPRTGGTPTGRVTVRAGSATLCAISLRAGKGSCTPAATRLRPGSYKITAAYPGDAAYSGSASASTTLAVAAEPTTTVLTLSTASVRLGHEQAEHLTVRVTPRFTGPAPAGKVVIKAGSARICTIALKSAKGGCTLRASQLRPGSHALTARYAATPPYRGSISAKKTLAVTK